MTPENFGNVPAVDDENKGHPKLVVWDFLGKNLEKCLLEFEVDLEMISLQCFVSIFNVRNGEGVEKNNVSRPHEKEGLK